MKVSIDIQSFSWSFCWLTCGFRDFRDSLFATKTILLKLDLLDEFSEPEKTSLSACSFGQLWTSINGPFFASLGTVFRRILVKDWRLCPLEGKLFTFRLLSFGSLFFFLSTTTLCSWKYQVNYKKVEKCTKNTRNHWFQFSVTHYSPL